MAPARPATQACARSHGLAATPPALTVTSSLRPPRPLRRNPPLRFLDLFPPAGRRQEGGPRAACAARVTRRAADGRRRARGRRPRAPCGALRRRRHAQGGGALEREGAGGDERARLAHLPGGPPHQLQGAGPQRAQRVPHVGGDAPAGRDPARNRQARVREVGGSHHARPATLAADSRRPAAATRSPAPSRWPPSPLACATAT